MAFCGNCGTQLQGDESFCVHCGKPLAATTAAAAMPAQPVVASPLPPGAIPVIMAPPQPVKKSHKLRWFFLLLLLALGAGYAYLAYHQPKKTADSELDATLASQQDFSAHWESADGKIRITQGSWTNHAIVPIQSATLECDQYDAGGAVLDKTRTTLNGPLDAGRTDTFDPFEMGAAAGNMSQVKCTIVDVLTSGSTQQ